MSRIASPIFRQADPSHRPDHRGSGFLADASPAGSHRRGGTRREFRLRRPRGAGQNETDGPHRHFDFRRPRRKPPFQLARLIWLVALLILVIFLIHYFGILSR
jgi:hypothetical protein